MLRRLVLATVLMCVPAAALSAPRNEATIQLSLKDGAYAVHPAVFFRACLEIWRGAKIICSRIDGLAAIEPINHLFRAMSKAFPAHIDLLRIISLKGDPGFDLQDLVTAHEHPAGATWQDRTLEFWSFKAAASEPSDAPAAIRSIAQIEHLNFKRERE